MNGDDSLLHRVHDYQDAAREAVGATDQPFGNRCLALIDLADAARGEDDPGVRGWAERAVWEEARAFLGDSEGYAFPPETYERKHRRLRVEGHERCPTCMSSLATQSDFERWRRLRQAHIEELQRRERALG